MSKVWVKDWNRVFPLHILNGKGADERSEEGKEIKDGEKMGYKKKKSQKTERKEKKIDWTVFDVV